MYISMFSTLVFQWKCTKKFAWEVKAKSFSVQLHFWWAQIGELLVRYISKYCALLREWFYVDLFILLLKCLFVSCCWIFFPFWVLFYNNVQVLFLPSIECPKDLINLSFVNQPTMIYRSKPEAWDHFHELTEHTFCLLVSN